MQRLHFNDFMSQCWGQDFRHYFDLYGSSKIYQIRNGDKTKVERKVSGKNVVVATITVMA